jgi:uncharacterized membrane protein YkvA (DUF1232 family)
MTILGGRGKLVQLLEEYCNKISALDATRDGPSMLDQVFNARPDTGKQWQPIFEGPGNIFKTAFGQSLVNAVKAVPEMIDMLVDQINAPSSTPALRCALVAVLAYVVQPHDVVPDDAPGGYGFVDDRAMLLAIALQLTEPTAANAKAIEDIKSELASLESTLPHEAVPALTQAIQNVVLLFQSMNVLPAEVAELTTRQLLDTPDRAVAPQAPSGWQVPSMSPSGQGTYSGGAYIEGNNMMFPGGLSLIDGKLNVPPPAESW